MKTYNSTVKTYSITKNKTDLEKVKITCSQDSCDFIRRFYSGDLEVYESFYLLLMNRANITEGYVKISQGGTAGTVVDVKIVARYAIEGLACNCIIAHNHPSGSLQPSSADVSITQRVKNALNLLDIQLLDHIILTADKYFSFADENIL